MIGGVAAAALVLAIAGFLIGRGGGGGEDQPEGTTSARSGAIGITYPSSWQRVDAGPAGAAGAAQLPGFEFTNPIAAGPRGETQNRLVSGLVDASGPALLPPEFVKALGADPDRGDTVRLGDIQAYRYRNLDPGGFEPALTIYAVPTDKGVATIACQADAAQADRFLPECERAASTLELEGAKAFELGPGREYVDRVNGTLDKLASGRARQLDQLESARTPDGQAKAAGNIARAYRSAAAGLRNAPVSPQVAATNDAIVGALDDAAAGWGEVREGAADGDRAEYRRGGQAVRRAERRLSQALARLGDLS